jgi:hypothetical protein
MVKLIFIENNLSKWGVTIIAHAKFPIQASTARHSASPITQQQRLDIIY